ncbi:MAG: Asp23/Gls24 family envelope stress response protein [Clostridia bacterium]|jgi:hypothetical protein|nr:Asp23/Gls24 family envelope stress response protein [Clostridia bacterium]
MHVCALVGASGTGKSHRSLWVAKEHNIEYVIDDGLLIKGNSVLAGRSAKAEKTRVAAIKTAVLTDDAHAFELRSALKENKAESVLILGTSDAMVQKIAARLGLGEINETIYIQDVSSPYEIQQALNTRRMEGKHVVPVPTMELKKNFSGVMLDPLNILRRRGAGSFETMGEKSVIRPTYSYLGRFTISDYTIYQLAEHAARENPAVSRITRFRADKAEDGIRIEMDIVLYYGHRIPSVFAELRRQIAEEIEKYTSLNSVAVILTAKNIIVKKAAKPEEALTPAATEGGNADARHDIHNSGN